MYEKDDKSSSRRSTNDDDDKEDTLHRRRKSHCVFCLKPTTAPCFNKTDDDDPESSSSLSVPIIGRAITFLERHLEMKPGGGGGRPPLLEFSSRCCVCGKCAPHLETFSSLYEQLREVELKLDVELFNLRNILQEANHVPTRGAFVKEVYGGRREEGLSTMEEMYTWRRTLSRKCNRKLSSSFPKVVLSKLEEEEEEESRPNPAKHPEGVTIIIATASASTTTTTNPPSYYDSVQLPVRNEGGAGGGGREVKSEAEEATNHQVFNSLEASPLKEDEIDIKYEFPNSPFAFALPRPEEEEEDPFADASYTEEESSSSTQKVITAEAPPAPSLPKGSSGPHDEGTEPELEYKCLICREIPVDGILKAAGRCGYYRPNKWVHQDQRQDNNNTQMETQQQPHLICNDCHQLNEILNGGGGGGGGGATPRCFYCDTAYGPSPTELFEHPVPARVLNAELLLRAQESKETGKGREESRKARQSAAIETATQRRQSLANERIKRARARQEQKSPKELAGLARKHARRKLKDKAGWRWSLECPDCEDKFLTRGEMRKHLYKVHRGFPCDQPNCLFRADRESRLQKHKRGVGNCPVMTTERMRQRFFCPICNDDKDWKRKRDLHRHLGSCKRRLEARGGGDGGLVKKKAVSVSEKGT